MKSSTENKPEDKMHEVKDKIKETGGKATGNKDLEARGKRENVEGKVQKRIGYVRKVGENKEVFLLSRHSLGTGK